MPHCPNQVSVEEQRILSWNVEPEYDKEAGNVSDRVNHVVARASSQVEERKATMSLVVAE